MFTNLETKRLYLKNIGNDDIEFIIKEFSSEKVNTYLYDADPILTKEESKELIDFYIQAEPRNQHRWIIILKDGNTKIGTCGFHCWDKENNKVEIGYDLQPEYWRNAYASEALKEIIIFAKNKMNVKTISANIFINNIASIKTAIKLGFYKSDNTYYENFHDKKYLHYIYRLDL